MRSVVLLLTGIFFAMTGQAAQAYPPSQQSAADLAEPAMVLRKGVETLTGYVEGRQAVPPQQLRAFLEREIAPYFDFPRMSYWAAGPLNRYFTPQQKERFTFLLRERFIGAMVEQLTGFEHTRLQYLPPRGNPASGDVTLGVRVYSVNAYPVELDFRLYRGHQGWRVYDVVANGSSAVAHYRQEFGLLARRYGIEGLLGYLQR